MSKHLGLYILTLFFYNSLHAEPICADTYAELEKSPALKKIQTLLENQKNNGFVNKTQGSYFFLLTNTEKFKIIFYTTGFLDLYGIHKESEIQFCDNDNQLTAIGLDRVQNLFIENNRLEFGERTDRESFIKGPMPEKLAQKNTIEPHLLGDEKT